MDGMTVWAHPMWEFLHRLPNFAVDDAKLDAAITAMVIMCNALPCGTCRQHSASYFRSRSPLQCSSAAELGSYLHAFHNTVRGRTGGKREPREVLRRYEGQDPAESLVSVQRGMALAQGDNSIGVRAAAVAVVRGLLTE